MLLTKLFIGVYGRPALLRATGGPTPWQYPEIGEGTVIPNQTQVVSRHRRHSIIARGQKVV